MSEPFDINLIALLGIKITKFSEKYTDKKTVTYYTIEITSNITKKVWQIEKRYSEFKSLHDILNKTYPNIPEIPKQHFLKLNQMMHLQKEKNY